MTTYLSYIGLVFFIYGLYYFLLSFRIYTPKHKTEGQRERFELWLKKFGTMMKVCSIGLILYGSYDFITHHTNKYRIGSRKWTDADKRILVQDLKKSKYISIYPQFADKACECMADNIVKNISIDDYSKIMNLKPNEGFVELRPYIKNCINEFRKQIYRIDPPDKNGWTKQDRLFLINEIKSSSEMLAKYPQFAEEASSCMADKIIKAITYEKHLEINLMPTNERFDVISPLIKTCSDTFNKRISLVVDTP